MINVVAAPPAAPKIVARQKNAHQIATNCLLVSGVELIQAPNLNPDLFLSFHHSAAFTPGSL